MWRGGCRPGLVAAVASAALVASAYAGDRLHVSATPRGHAFVQQGRKLLPAHPGELSHFAGTVAISGDGNTAIVGAPGEGPGNGPGRRGAAFVYVRSHGRWKRTATLRANDQTRQAGLGGAVALSDDGRTALVTGDGDTRAVGAAWVFTRSGNRWKQQGTKLNGIGLLVGHGATGFGMSAALSANGNTALVGAYFDLSAFVFQRERGKWHQEGPKLTGVDAQDVALSDDGRRALITAGTTPAVFTRSPRGKWDLNTRLTACPCPSRQGQADDATIAMSGDGKTVALGDTGYNISQGAVYVFSPNARGGWPHRGVRLTVRGTAGFNPYVGNSLGLSRDGRTLLIGAESDFSGVGAAWVFRRHGGRWSQDGRKLLARDEAGPGAGNFASSLALPGDGNTEIIGGSSERKGAAAAWIFVARPRR